MYTCTRIFTNPHRTNILTAIRKGKTIQTRQTSGDYLPTRAITDAKGLAGHWYLSQPRRVSRLPVHLSGKFLAAWLILPLIHSRPLSTTKITLRDYIAYMYGELIAYESGTECIIPPRPPMWFITVCFSAWSHVVTHTTLAMEDLRVDASQFL